MYTENGETRRSVRKMGLVSREDEYLSVVDSVTLLRSGQKEVERT